MNPSPGISQVIKELHGDLAAKYKRHGAKVEDMWRSFDKSKRAQAFKAGAAEGVVLKDATDRSMGNVYKIMPELNERDITEPGSDYLLKMLKYRATTSLTEQYCSGVNGGPGDHMFIINSMRTNNLRHADSFKFCFTMFMDEDGYGQSYKSRNQALHDEAMVGLAPAVNAGLCVPQSTGELILQRQLYILQTLNILIEDILDGGSTSRRTAKLPKKPEEAARTALSKLSIAPKPDKLSLEDLLASATDQKSSMEDYVSLCREEAVFLAHVVNIWFFSRPELVKDEKGSTMPILTDKYISIAIFEAIQNAVTCAAVWNYLCRLLQLLIDKPKDTLHRNIVLQEISNVCHFEFGRAQKFFKRHVQTASGAKYFRRIAGKYDNGTARVSLKIKPDLLMRENPRLQVMLRLCESGVDASRSVPLIKKLDDLHRSHPSEREEMEEREFESFGDLAVIATFVQSLSGSLPLPPMSLKKGQIYVSRLKDLSAELNSLKTEIDLSAYTVPIDNLLEPGMADGALSTLDGFVAEKTGTKMGFLYQDLLELCVSETQGYYQQQKATIEQKTKVDTVPLFTDTPAPEVRVEQRRQKDKTRPAHSSVYDIAPKSATSLQPETVEPPRVFKVKQDTFDTFKTLFSKSTSRGAISWTAFEAALADLKFSVMPKFGSVFTFFPPEGMGVQNSITLHRPHKSSIEGYQLLMFARRLKRVYGWEEKWFEVA
ncbi:hypothetical protein LSUE1_G005899 [Lachnellula suecica]|uniref:Ipa protein n=1 Tax=Lachnellula suecica TaxID=602035 RepID=A0A8T9C3M0_9HELO|nr:hypothetical protein LSUE1_G005899 [Lachnellula suecica]